NGSDIRAKGSHRIDLASTSGARTKYQGYPQIRRDRHQPRGDQSFDQRSHRIPASDRHRAKGRTIALLDTALGERTEEASADSLAFQPRTRTDLGTRARFHRWNRHS